MDKNEISPLFKNKLKYELNRDKIACEIHRKENCTWQEAFDRADTLLFYLVGKYKK